MSSIKVVDDDYYSSENTSKEDKKELPQKDKKPKIIWKIKIKKDDETKESKELKENKELKESKVKKNIENQTLEIKKNTQNQSNKKSIVLEKKFIKKDNETKEVVGLKKEKGEYKTEYKTNQDNKKDFKKPYNNLKKDFKKDFKKPNENETQNNNDKKTINTTNTINTKSFNTKTKDFGIFDEEIEKKEWDLSIVWKDKPKKFLNPIKKVLTKPNSTTNKSWKDKFNEEDRVKKWFKKDKSNKHSKWFFIQEEDEFWFSRSNKIKDHKKKEKDLEQVNQNLVARTWETIIVSDVFSIKEFSDKLWLPVVKVIAEFIKNWMKVTLNSKIDYETASIVAESFNIKLEKDNSSWFWIEEIISWDISSLIKEDDNSKLEKRTPVVSIMWHVDHWKTSLLDYIRKTKVALKEAWWITQSIWAYEVNVWKEKITFLDTPGHEAFTIMRARWAKSTDIAVLVVASDDWVKPQTIESINHALEAWLQIIVAITKIDKPWANPEAVKSGLAMNWLLVEWYGWNVPFALVSSKTWEWIDELLEIILLTSELLELKANPNRQAVWTVLESHLDTSLWPVSSVLINTWTLNKWDCVVCKWSFWRVKLLKNYSYKNVAQIWPWEPALIIWFDSVLVGWDVFQVVSDIEKARTRATEYKELMDSKSKASASWIDMIMLKIKSWALKQLKVIVKSDTNWSLEAIKWALLKLSTPETKVTIIHSWVWNITESDAMMWHGSNAIIVWYNVDLLWNSKNYIEKSKIEYISSKVIYHITERIEKIVSWMLDPKEVEVFLWNAIVWWIFFDWEWFQIVWLKLLKDGKIEKWAEARVIRKWKYIWKWKIENLKSWIIDVNDIEWPTECWIKLVINEKIELWDELEIFKIEIQK